jgi:hypothetical protein
MEESMKYLRGNQHEFLSGRLKAYNVRNALAHGSGGFLYIYDSTENLMRVIELKAGLSFFHMHVKYHYDSLDNLYVAWAKDIETYLEKNNDEIRHHVANQKGEASHP